MDRQNGHRWNNTKEKNLLLWKGVLVLHSLKSGQTQGRWSDLVIMSCCDVTHLARKQRTLVSLDCWWCRTCCAWAAGSCTWHCPLAAGAAKWGCSWCRWGRGPRTEGLSQWETEKRMEGCCRGDSLNGTASPQEPSPSYASDSPLLLPSPPHLGWNRGARQSPRHMSLSAPCPLVHGHLQGGKGRETNVTHRGTTRSNVYRVRSAVVRLHPQHLKCCHYCTYDLDLNATS